MRIAIPLMLLFTVCNQAGTSGSKDSTVTTADGTETFCYSKVHGRDTSKLSLVMDEETVNGTLEYSIYEKDKNMGVIVGTLNDNILRGTYNFQSEGVQSKRDVVFKVMGEQVYEALADSINAEGLPVFNPEAALLKFDPVPFKKTICE